MTIVGYTCPEDTRLRLELARTDDILFSVVRALVALLGSKTDASWRRAEVPRRPVSCEIHRPD